METKYSVEEAVLGQGERRFVRSHPLSPARHSSSFAFSCFLSPPLARKAPARSPRHDDRDAAPSRASLCLDVRMVHDCIIASSNMYEPARPPRRGSHRQATSFYPPLSDWPERSELFEFRDYAAPVCRDQDSPPLSSVPRGPSYLPSFQREEPWTSGNLFPPKRYASATQLPATNSRAFCAERPSLSTYDRQYFFETSLGPRISGHASVDTKVRTSLHRLRQLNGGTTDRSLIDRVIFESNVRSAPQSAACQSSQKRCMYPGCSKISVSRGLCRGHGGGRRCHVPNCTKSAQSRSNFCWAHGGGARCDADNCMRSRKSKRFCVAHLHLEDASDNATTTKPTTDARKKTSFPRSASPVVPTKRALPSLGQALSSASRSAPNLPARGSKLAVAM